MNLNFDEFRGDFFSVDGRKVATFEDCKEWIAIKFHFRGWDGLLMQKTDQSILKQFEDLSLDLYSFLLDKGEIE